MATTALINGAQGHIDIIPSAPADHKAIYKTVNVWLITDSEDEANLFLQKIQDVAGQALSFVVKDMAGTVISDSNQTVKIVCRTMTQADKKWEAFRKSNTEMQEEDISSQKFIKTKVSLEEGQITWQFTDDLGENFDKTKQKLALIENLRFLIKDTSKNRNKSISLAIIALSALIVSLCFPAVRSMFVQIYSAISRRG